MTWTIEALNREHRTVNRLIVIRACRQCCWFQPQAVQLPACCFLTKETVDRHDIPDNCPLPPTTEKATKP